MNDTRILLVAEDARWADLLADRLRERGAVVGMVHGTRIAWETVTRAAPDAVILDVSRSGAWGHETLWKLKSNPATAALPVVVVAAHDDPAIPETARRLGAAGVLRQPVPWQQVYVVLCRALGRVPDLGEEGRDAA